MILATAVFATQDGLSRFLAEKYNVISTIVIRFWFLAICITGYLFVVKKSRYLIKTNQPLLQITRSCILILEILVTVYSFTIVGLVTTSAIFSCYPLLAALFAVLFLREQLSNTKVIAIIIGFFGVIYIIQPGTTIFQISSLLPLFGAVLFALYGVLTRKASFKDNSYTSFIWTGLTGGFLATLSFPFYWEPILGEDIIWMGILSILGLVGHFLLIKAFEVAEASSIQPFAFFHLVFASTIGTIFFSEDLTPSILIGSIIVISSGIFYYSREKSL
jgi:drug/metabolite transporter (DMT)-like permease